MKDSPFPSYPRPSLSREDVVGFLTEMKAQGWEVYTTRDEDFVLAINELDQLIFTDQGTYCILSRSRRGGDPRKVGTAESLSQLRDIVGEELPSWKPPKGSTHLKRREPASNYSRIAKLISPAKVTAVHDPYLDDKGLANLLTIVYLAHSVTPDIRLLTSNRVGKRLNPHYVKSWFQELGCSLREIRKVSTSNPHRRFMLLTGGQSLILGCSLNDLEKDETARLEKDTDDKPFFESEWEAASPFTLP